jgi:hypothetical protein
MISKKGLIALIAVIVLIGTGIYFALSYNPVDETEEKPVAENTTVLVYDKDVSTLKEINVKLYDEEFSFVLTGNEYKLKKNPNASLKSSYVNELASNVAVMTAKDVIEEDASDLEKYGFYNPRTVIKAVFDNEEKVIIIGGQTYESAYFMHIEGETKVYSIYSTRGDLLVKPLSYYRDLSLLKVTGTSLIKAQIKSEKENLTVEKINDKWFVTNPMYKDVNESVLNEKIFAPISYFEAKEFVDETNNNYAQYGLLNPEKSVYLEDDFGIKQTFYFGNTDGNVCYARLSSKDGVFTMDVSTMDIFDVKASQMTDMYVTLPNIKEIKKITIFKDGKTYTLERGETDYKINGVSSDEESYRQVYMAVLSAKMSDFCVVPYTNNLFAKAVFEYNDLSIRTFEYMDYSSRQTIVYENKKSMGYVQKSDITNAIEMFK